MFQRNDESQVERCSVCGTVTDWFVWSLPMCNAHVREWEDAIPYPDEIADDTARHAEVKRRTVAWVQAKKKRGAA